MKRTIQIFIKDVDGVFQRIDLFKDETISITDKIQDVRDIAKVFTEFTQGFTVPSSKTNNKLFKHFYNADISNGFDARSLSDARIEINNINFKSGLISLDGVDMKNNKPSGYRLTFYGKTVDLKDIIGEDDLSTLSFDDTLTKSYTPAEVETLLTTNPATAGNDIIAPLITHTQRLFYNSSTSAHINDSGNLYYHTGSSHDHGVRWDNIKYAIRVGKIIDAIEAKYTTGNGYAKSVTFSNEFFSSTNDQFHNLFMWMHREKGSIIKEEDVFSVNVSNFSATTGSTDYVSVISTNTNIISFTRRVSVIDLTTAMSGSPVYDVIVTHSTLGVISEVLNISGPKTNLNLPLSSFPSDGNIRVEIRSKSAIVFTTFTLGFSDIEGPTEQDVAVSSNINLNNTLTFVPKDEIPNMKIIDFLTGLFKMFNLTAFVETQIGVLDISDVIYVDTLDEFYKNKVSLGSPYSIDEYVVSGQHTVDSALPYKEVSFSYEDTDTLLAKKHKEINPTSSGDAWGEERYNHIQQSINTNFSGDVYDVEAPFGHMKFERLIDGNNGSNTVIQWGYSADDDFDEATGNYGAYIGKPLLFYPVYTSVSSNPISFVDSIVINTDNPGELDDFADHKPINGSINMPSNSISFDASVSTKNINFKNENNEYNIDPSGSFSNPSGFVNTLFNQYYDTYITQVFTKSNRIIKLKAFLPLRILLNYTLADKFIYKGRKHQINSITTNLNTGESEIELLNIVIE